MNTVPSEIILAIAEHLQPVTHQSTLLSLCLVDKKTYQLAKLYLYRHVELNSHGAIVKFCRTLTVFCPRNASYVVTLCVYPLAWRSGARSSDHIRKDIVPDLRSVLKVVPNLKHLFLSVTRKALVLLLVDLHPTFRLHTLAHSGDMSGPLLKFLNNQPSLINHGWYGLPSWSMCRSLQDAMNLDRTFLANLRAATGPANFLAALMLSRPLSSVTILIRTWRCKSPSGLDQECTGPREIMGWTKFMYGAYKGGLKLMPPCDSLREICIAETPLKIKRPGSGYVNIKNYMRAYLQSLLHHFNRIERLEVVCLQPLPHGATAFTVHPWLLDMNDMCAWTQLGTSLKYVSIYGHVIPQATRNGQNNNLL
ncbi:unnamed protein product [Rhizoctonia solani]|uniref:Uncharacterized protein n=1 Tax=Rhizoctonia solani TaxID=456999 RepID=A0A8H3CXD4_9AGAM|nr:unnamed protein product [Rhizoctonia solani]